MTASTAPADCEELGVRVELQREPDGDETERDEQEQRLGRGQAPGRERAILGARDPGVQVAVGVVVDHAAGRARHDDAGDEDDQDSRIGPAIARDPESPHAGQSRSQIPIGLCRRMRRAYSRSVRAERAECVAQRIRFPFRLVARIGGPPARVHACASGRNTSCTRSRQPAIANQERRAQSDGGGFGAIAQRAMIEAIAGDEACELERPALEPGHGGEAFAERGAAERGQPALVSERRLRDQRLCEHPGTPVAGELDLAHESGIAAGLEYFGVLRGERSVGLGDHGKSRLAAAASAQALGQQARFGEPCSGGRRRFGPALIEAGRPSGSLPQLGLRRGLSVHTLP